MRTFAFQFSLKYSLPITHNPDFCLELSKLGTILTDDQMAATVING